MNTRDLARAVLEPEFTVAGMLARAEPHEVVAAVTSYEASLVPLKEVDPDLKGAIANKIRVTLRPTGAKLAPQMSPRQASAWADAILLSVSKWPPSVCLAAARAVVHETFEYGLGGVDAKLHELAAAIDARHRLALFRLQRMQAEIERALHPPTPQLAPPAEDPQPIGYEEAVGYNLTLLGVARRNGWLAEGVYERITEERDVAAAAQMIAAAALQPDAAAKPARASVDAMRIAARIGAITDEAFALRVSEEGLAPNTDDGHIGASGRQPAGE